MTPSLVPDEAADHDLMVGVKATEVCTAWSRADILKAQQADPSISTILQQLSGDNDLPSGGEYTEKSDENGERRRYRQLWSQLELVDGVLHRSVDKGTPSQRLVLIVPREMRADLLRLAHDVPSSGHMGINGCFEVCNDNIIGQGWGQKCNYG